MIVGEPLDNLRRGKIIAFRGSWQSGIAELVFDTTSVFCENAATVRALESCFGKVTGEGHTVNNIDGGHLDQEVYFSVDAFNILVAFTPVDEAPQEMHDLWNAQEAENA